MSASLKTPPKKAAKKQVGKPRGTKGGAPSKYGEPQIGKTVKFPTWAWEIVDEAAHISGLSRNEYMLRRQVGQETIDARVQELREKRAREREG